MELDELRACLKAGTAAEDEAEKLFQKIRAEIYSEVNYNELAAVRLMRVLRAIFAEDEAAGHLVLHLLASPFDALAEAAKRAGLSKSAAMRKIEKMSSKHPEIRLFIRLRSGSIPESANPEPDIPPARVLPGGI